MDPSESRERLCASSAYSASALNSLWGRLRPPRRRVRRGCAEKTFPGRLVTVLHFIHTCMKPSCKSALACQVLLVLHLVFLIQVMGKTSKNKVLSTKYKAPTEHIGHLTRYLRSSAARSHFAKLAPAS